MWRIIHNEIQIIHMVTVPRCCILSLQTPLRVKIKQRSPQADPRMDSEFECVWYVLPFLNAMIINISDTWLYIYIYVKIHYVCKFHIYIYIQYITLHYITLHYTTLHYTTFHYITLHYTTLHYITIHYITLHCKALHLHYICIALHYIYIALH